MKKFVENVKGSLVKAKDKVNNFMNEHDEEISVAMTCLYTGFIGYCIGGLVTTEQWIVSNYEVCVGVGAIAGQNELLKEQNKALLERSLKELD